MSTIARNTKAGGSTNVQDGQTVLASDINTDMNTLYGDYNGGITNANISASAAIAFSKVASTGAIVNADVNASAAIAYSKLNLATSIVNADVNASAAIAYSKLNLASSVTTADIAAAGIAVSKLDAPYPLDSGIVNGFFDWWQRNPSASGVSVTAATDTYIADRWAVEPIGANCSVSRVTTGLHTSAVSDVGISLTGAASMTSIELTQRIPRATARRLGASLANQNVTFGAKIRHTGSAGTITPTLIVRSTSNTGDDTTATKFAAANMTARVTQAFSGITNGNEASLSHTFDLGAMTDSENGIEIVLSFAAMSASTHVVTVTDVFLIRGAVAPLTLVRPDAEHEFMLCSRFYQKTFNYATTPAQSAGLTGVLVGAGNDVGGNNCGIGWSHGRMMRTGGTLTTYNPSSANTGARNSQDADDAALQGSSAGQFNSYAYFNTGPAGTSKTAFHVHMTIETEWYD